MSTQRIQTNQTQTPVAQPRLNLFYRFFCWCSGADLDTLENYPADWNRFMGTGIIIFLTGVFATFSSGYALSSVFKDFDPQTNINTVNYWTVVPVAFLWGLFIFFLDRYFISSMTAAPENKLRQFYIAIPRLVLAVFLGIVISRPIEYRLFRDDIMVELGDEKERQLAQLEERFDKRENEVLRQDSVRKSQTEIGRKILAEERTIAVFNGYKSEAEKEIAAALDSMNYENVGAGKSKVKGEGPNFKRWREEHNRLLNKYYNRDLPLWDGQIKTAQDSINSYNRKPDLFKEKIEKETAESRKKLNEERVQARKFKQENFSFSLLSLEAGLNNLMTPKEENDSKKVSEKIEISKDTSNKIGLSNLTPSKGQSTSNKIATSKDTSYKAGLSNLTPPKDETNPEKVSEKIETSKHTSNMVLFVSLLFILIETAPILVKLFSKSGDYEKAIEASEAEVILNLRQQRNVARQEFKTNKGLIQKMARSQRNVVRDSIKYWEIKERADQRRKQTNTPEEDED